MAHLLQVLLLEEGSREAISQENLLELASGFVGKGLLKAFEDPSDRCRESATSLLAKLIEVTTAC